MDLKTFVSETLTQIAEGVQDAQQRIAQGGSGASVNPENVPHNQRHGQPRPVEFDVAVVAGEETSENKGKKVGASVGLISVLSVRASGEIDNRNIGAQRNETTSRIRFTVMLAQPSELTQRPAPRIPKPTDRGWTR